MLFSNGMYAEAADAFFRFEEAQPDHPSAAEARFYRAESLRANGNVDESIPVYESFRDDYANHPLRPRALLTLGRHLYNSGRYLDSRQTLNEVFETTASPEVTAETTYWLGMASYGLTQPDVALAYFEQVYTRFPDSEVAPTSLYMSGKIDLERGRYEAAADSFDQLATQYPNVSLSQNVGLALVEANYELGRYERAATEAENRLNGLQGTNLERAILLLAESANQLGDYQRAMYYYDQLTTRFPQSEYLPFGYFGKGWADYRQENYLAAASSFGASARIGTGSIAHEASYYRGVCLLLAGRTDEARQQFSETVANAPQGAFADQSLFELGASYFEDQNFQAATTTFDRIVRQYPSSSRVGESLLLMGESYAALSDLDQAFVAFDNALQSNQIADDVRAEISFRKAWLLYQSSRFAEAQRLFSADYKTTGNPDALYWAAESHFQQNELGAAESLYREYVQNFSSGEKAPAAQYALGWIYFKQSKYLDATRAFRLFVDTFQPSEEQEFYLLDARLRIADSFYALRRFDDAILEYRRVGRSGTIYALYQIGQSYVNSGEDNEALNAFRGIVGNYPNSEWAPEAQYSIAYIYLQRQENDRARQEFNRVVSNYPGSSNAPRALYGVGDAYFNENRFSDAIAAYKEVLARYPESPVVADALQGIQFAALAAGDPVQADLIINEFIASNPTSPLMDEVRFRQAETKVQNGNYAESIVLLNNLLRRDLDGDLLPAVYYYLGFSYAQINDVSRADQYLRQVAREFPTDNFAILATQRLGTLLLDSGRFTEAYQIYLSLEDLGAGNQNLVAEAMYGQANALLAQGRLADGEALLREMITSYPETQETRRGRLRLANLHLQNGRVGEARSEFLELASGNDDVAVESLFRYASLLLQQGDFVGALREFANIPDRFEGYLDWEAQSYLGQARAYRGLSRTADAIVAYDKVINEYSDTPFAQIAQDEKAAL